MKDQVQHYSSRLFKSDQRGNDMGVDFRCFSTFNYGHYEQPGREPFGALQFINDNYIAPAKSHSFNYQNITELIIPIAGTVLMYPHG